MAYTLTSTETRSIELDEYIEYLESHINVQDVDELAKAADISKRLYNNRTFLVNHINHEMRDMNKFQSSNPYSSMSLLLSNREDFFIRANFWSPIADKADYQKHDNVFIYGKPHCHNFHFLTIGYLGSGYETEIFEYHNDKVEGHYGEPVELKFLEKTDFPEGKIMIYRKGLDVHTQSPSKEFSVSINVMVKEHGEKLRQFYFDTNKKIITGNATVDFRTFLLGVVGSIGDENSYDILRDYAQHNPDPVTRVTALQSLNKISQRTGTNETSIWLRSAEDRSRHVRDYAQSILASGAV